VWQLRDEFHKLDSEEAFDAKKKKKILVAAGVGN
jgi:hypothetical protein